MSHRATSWAWAQPLEPGPKFVLLALADFADEDDSCFPGQGLIARMTGQGERSVRRHLADLEAGGFLTREHRYHRDGNRKSDRYVLILPSANGHSVPAKVAKKRAKPEPLPANLATSEVDYRPNETPLPAKSVEIPATVAGSEPKELPVEPIEAPSAPSTKTKDSPKKRTAPPATFEVTPELRSWAEENAITADLDYETRKWLDHHTSKGSRMIDWTACWRLWMRRSGEYAPTTGSRFAQTPAPRRPQW